MSLTPPINLHGFVFIEAHAFVIVVISYRQVKLNVYAYWQEKVLKRVKTIYLLWSLPPALNGTIRLSMGQR